MIKKKKNDNYNIIHITSVGGCEKAFEYAMKGEKKAPSHFTSVKGTMTHSVVRQLMEADEVLSWKFNDLIEKERRKVVSENTFNKLLPDVKILVEHAKEWKSQTNLLDNQELIIEEPLATRYKDFIIMGTPDLYTSESIIDIKSGSGRMSKEYKQQLAGYDWLLKRNGKEGFREHYDVFLGNEDKPFIERKITSKERSEGRGLFLKNLDETINTRNLIIQGKKEAECRFNFTCVFCAYRGCCVGI